MITNIRRAFARIFCTCALLTLVAAAHAQTSTLTYISGGKSIRIDWFQAAGSGAHPAIAYVYGMDGMSLFPQSYTMIGQWMASQGYEFYIVHYFDATGTTIADPVSTVMNYSTWVNTINDGITWIGKQSTTNPKRIGLMGISLGSFLALSVAENNMAVKAVSETSGGLTSPNPAHLPPTLILHGANDTIVPVSMAQQLGQALAKLNVPYQLQIYPNEGHMGFSLSDELDSMSRTLTFFNQYLTQ